MKAGIYNGPEDIRVEDVSDPRISEPTDAIVRITHACICGSDLWFYRGIAKNWEPGWRTGHELAGVVEAVGSDVTSFKAGDVVIAPFVFSDGTCEFCRIGLQTSCVNGSAWGGPDQDGGQGEAARVPFADATLVAVPKEAQSDDALMRSILPLTDVMGTGHHAAVAAGVSEGSTAAVVGDGAVGLCGVLAAARLGADRIIMLGHHDDRLELARKFGATDVVTSRDEEAIEEVQELTSGGTGSVLECVGNQSAMDTAIGIARPGGTVGFVGVPHAVQAFNVRRMFGENISIAGGVAPVRAYMDELLDDVLAGRLDPGPVLSMEVGLDDLSSGYAAMDQRTALKVMVRP
ncbi:MAG: zinc-dependent alcohol dehydrogenase family protein [Actinomycetota bacterium]|nr:zinc-dependent alcohol dehydrogenase family protein [Actinomycetota bacterium]